MILASLQVSMGVIANLLPTVAAEQIFKSCQSFHRLYTFYVVKIFWRYEITDYFSMTNQVYFLFEFDYVKFENHSQKF